MFNISSIYCSRTTEFTIDLDKEKLRDIGKEFADAFLDEIHEEYPDSLEQDIPDIVHQYMKVTSFCSDLLISFN